MAASIGVLDALPVALSLWTNWEEEKDEACETTTVARLAGAAALAARERRNLGCFLNLWALPRCYSRTFFFSPLFVDSASLRNGEHSQICGPHWIPSVEKRLVLKNASESNSEHFLHKPMAGPHHHQECPILLGKFSRMRNYSISKTATAELGRARLACSSINTCAASRDPISAASAVANCGWNYCWWINWQRRLESWSSSSSLQRGWSARIATRWSSHHPACSIRYQSLHVSSPANDSFKKFTGARSRRPHHSHFSHGRQNRRSSFCRCRPVREEVRILVTTARFVKPLFANMHHHVHAVAGALQKPNFPCPHPDVSTWPVW